MSNSYSTNFPLTENPISENTNWVCGGTVGLDWGNPVSTPGKCWGVGSALPYGDAHAYLQNMSWDDDQSAEGTVFVSAMQAGCAPEIELHLRSQVSAHRSVGYEITWSVGESYFILVRWNGALGDFTYLKHLDGSQYNVANGDHIKATIVGSTISAYKNGVLVTTVNDNVWTSGAPGIGFNSEDLQARPGCPGSNTAYGFSSFSATGLGGGSTGGGTPPPPPPPPPPPTGNVVRLSEMMIEVVGVGLGTPDTTDGSGGSGGTGSEGTAPARVSQMLGEVVISSNAIGVSTLPCTPPTSAVPCNEDNFKVTASGSVPFPVIAAADTPAVDINGQPYSPNIAIGGGIAPAFWNNFEFSPIDSAIYTTTAYNDPCLKEQQRISKINRSTNSIEWSTPYRMFDFKSNAITESITNNCEAVPDLGVDGIVTDRTILLHDMCVSPDGKFLVTCMSGTYILSGLNHVESDPGGSFIRTYLEKRSIADGGLLHTRVINDFQYDFGADGEIFVGENTNVSGCVNVDDGRVYFGFITQDSIDSQTPTIYIVNDNLDTVARVAFPANWPTLGISPLSYYAAMDNHARYWFAIGSNQLGVMDLNGNITTYTLSEILGWIDNTGPIAPYIHGIMFDPIDNSLLIFAPQQSFTAGTVYDTYGPDSSFFTGAHTSGVIYKFDIPKIIANDPARLVKTVDWGPCMGSGFYLRPGNSLTAGANKLCTTKGTAILHDLSDVTRLDRAVENAPGGMSLTENDIITSSLDNTTTNPHTASSPLWGTYWIAYTDLTWKWFDMVRVSCPASIPSCEGVNLGDCGCGGGPVPPPGLPGALGDCYGRTPSSVWEAVVVGGGIVGVL